MVAERLRLPPLPRTTKILEKYYENLNSMDRIDALCLYRNSMAVLYKVYNPHLRVRYWKREDFLPKEDDYDEE